MDLSFNFIEIPQENHAYVPLKAIYEGLKILYQDWVMPAGVAKKGFGAINAFYDDLSKKYGYRLIIPESAYTQLIGSVATHKEALKMALLYTEKYPNSSSPFKCCSKVYLSTWVKKRLIKAGFPELVLHNMRDTFASIQLKNGTPIREVSRYLGHKNVMTTESIYAHDVYKKVPALGI